MLGTWNNGRIMLNIPPGTTSAVLVVMFNDGLEKVVNVYNGNTNAIIHHIRSTDNRPTPFTRVLKPGGSYVIKPFYIDDNTQKGDFTVQEYADSQDIGNGDSGYVTHRDFRVSVNDSPQKINITIVLVDDDVSPNGANSVTIKKLLPGEDDRKLSATGGNGSTGNNRSVAASMDPSAEAMAAFAAGNGEIMEVIREPVDPLYL